MPLLFLCSILSAQYNIGSGDIQDCDNLFFDSGGSNGRYRNNENSSSQICSNQVGSVIQLIFSELDLRSGDELCFYDGPDDSFPLLGCLDENTALNNLIVQATQDNPTGCISAYFESSFLFRGDGWRAEINCVPICQLIQSELVFTEPAASPPDPAWIDICPGVVGVSGA